jgi:hypothetical protein
MNSKNKLFSPISFFYGFSVIEMRGFWAGFNSWKLCNLLVLQWWLSNKLGFGDFGGFAKLGGQRVGF